MSQREFICDSDNDDWQHGRVVADSAEEAARIYANRKCHVPSDLDVLITVIDPDNDSVKVTFDVTIEYDTELFITGARRSVT